MASKSSGRRCPNCGAAAANIQNFCSRCGTPLPVVSPAPVTTGSGRIGKALVGLFVLVAIIGIVNRLISDEDSINSSSPSATQQAQLQPSRTPESRGRAPTRTPVFTIRTLATEPAAIDDPLGFSPAIWTATLPPGVKPGNIVTIIDGDTFDILVAGQTNRYRLYRADTPETYAPLECGGNDATAFVRSALAQSDTPNQVWVEDVSQPDQHGRTLTYLWFTIDGKPFLLNHLLINSGWAENVNYGDDFDPYRSELGAAASYAYTNGLGVWGVCGDFGIPSNGAFAAPIAPPIIQPTESNTDSSISGCHPGYIPCVPISSVDLDCRDVGFRVEVIGNDEYWLDNDDPDLIGCESWPPKS